MVSMSTSAAVASPSFSFPTSFPGYRAPSFGVTTFPGSPIEAPRPTRVTW